MINEIIENIQEHLSLLDLAVHCSERVKVFAQTEDLDRVVSETENRDRIISIVGDVQKAIEDQINRLTAGSVTAEEILILKSWFQDLSLCTDKMLAIDNETVELLTQQKENTSKEIALIFRNKEMFKGYNQLGKK